MTERTTTDNYTEDATKGVKSETYVHIDAQMAYLGYVTLYANVAEHMFSPDLETLSHAIKALAKDTLEVAELIRATAIDMGINCKVSRPQYADYSDCGGCVGITLVITPPNQTINLLVRSSEATDTHE